MMEEKRVIFGIYKSETDMKAAMAILKNDFESSEISVVMPRHKSTKAFEGGLIGGAIGLLLGAGALAIPGVGTFIVSGPVLAAIADAGVGTAVGGIAGALIGLGMVEREAERYEKFMKSGNIILSVHTDTFEESIIALQVLRNTGAEDVSSIGEVDGKWRLMLNDNSHLAHA